LIGTQPSGLGSETGESSKRRRSVDTIKAHVSRLVQAMLKAMQTQGIVLDCGELLFQSAVGEPARFELVVVCFRVTALLDVDFVVTAFVLRVMIELLIQTFRCRLLRRGRRCSGTVVGHSCLSLEVQVTVDHRKL